MTVSFDDLYPKQKEVAVHEGSPLLILAGPGTGKTEVLAQRLIYLVRKRRVDPNRILAVTFTTKAASAMEKRIKDAPGLGKMSLRVSTLHSEAYRILRENIDRAKLPREFVIADEDETLMLLRDASEDVSFRAGTKQLKRMRKEISLKKADNIAPSEISTDATNIWTNSTKKLYERYEQLLLFNKAVDLDDLLVTAVRLLRENKDSLDIYKIRTPHLLVDEYQDINQAQYDLIELISQDSLNLFAVGDDDQSIYAFRGANPKIILNFEKDFPGAEVKALEECRRCGGHILKGALAMVSNNQSHKHKPLKTIWGKGAPIYILRSSSEIAEARWIANRIFDNVSSGRWQPQDIVTMCKDLEIAKDVVREIKDKGIDVVYWKRGGLFADKDVRIILAHIRLVNDQNDNLALRRCLATKTGEGIGKKGVRTIRLAAQKSRTSLWNVMTDLDTHRSLTRWQERLSQFIRLINDLDSKVMEFGVHYLIGVIVDTLGISENRYVDELKKIATSMPDETNVSDFIEEVNKKRGIDVAEGGAEAEAEGNAVAIMSMHSAKGLTFDVAFILGLEEGILPNPKYDLEEQRRLFYVAMTRARKYLFICHALWRMGPAARGISFFDHPSSLIAEIPSEYRKNIPNYTKT